MADNMTTLDDQARVDATKDEDLQKVVDELESKLKGMRKDMQAKGKAAREQLVEQLGIMSQQYITANGLRDAMGKVQELSDGEICTEERIAIAAIACKTLHDVCLRMQTDAKVLDIRSLEQVTEGTYDPEFVRTATDGTMRSQVTRIVVELMELELCQHVGPRGDDIRNFMERCEDEIADTKKALKAAKARLK